MQLETSTHKEQYHGEENHITETTKHTKRNRVVKKTYYQYITGGVEGTQEEKLGKF
jgi:hypothetical protein